MLFTLKLIAICKIIVWWAFDERPKKAIYFYHSTELKTQNSRWNIIHHKFIYFLLVLLLFFNSRRCVYSKEEAMGGWFFIFLSLSMRCFTFHSRKRKSFECVRNIIENNSKFLVKNFFILEKNWKFHSNTSSKGFFQFKEMRNFIFFSHMVARSFDREEIKSTRKRDIILNSNFQASPLRSLLIVF